MTRDQLRINVFRGTLSGYLRIVVRLALGLVTFRLLYQGLSAEEFGFWSLLWSVFGFGVLVDFGFGTAAQKRVAELSVRRDWEALGRILSTILIAYVLGAVLLVLAGWLGAEALVDLFKASPENRETFRFTLQVFLLGIGLAFPLGIFGDVLQGQQRIATANNLALAAIVANCACVVLVMGLQLGFTILVVLTLLAAVLPNFVAAWLALRTMPQVRLGPRQFSGAALRDILRFGVFAYLNQLSAVVRGKADQPIISAILGVAAVTPYQGGGKIGEMFGILTRQLADVLSPTAAHLHARGDADGLRNLLFQGLRFSVLSATPLYLVTAIYLDGLIRLITGVAKPTADMLWVGHLLLFWAYSQNLTHWVFKRMYLMAGQERRMMWQGVAEAAANLALSVGLTFAFRSIQGVAWGSVLPTLLFGWLLLWGWTAREAGLSRRELFRRVLIPAWKGCLPMLIVAAAFHWQPFWPSGARVWQVLLEGGIVLAIGLAGVWQLALSPADRIRLRQLLRPADGAAARSTPALRTPPEPTP